jgi:hypothetical protein
MKKKETKTGNTTKSSKLEIGEPGRGMAMGLDFGTLDGEVADMFSTLCFPTSLLVLALSGLASISGMMNV